MKTVVGMRLQGRYFIDSGIRVIFSNRMVWQGQYRAFVVHKSASMTITQLALL